MWFTVLAACRPDPTAELRQEPPIAGCESTLVQYYTQPVGSGTELTTEPTLAQRRAWDQAERLVHDEVELYGEQYWLYTAAYDARDNLVEEYWWVEREFSRLSATIVEGRQVIEYTYEYGSGDVGDETVARTDTVTNVWSGGVQVASLWDTFSDGVLDDAVSYDLGWEGPDRWSGIESYDYGLDGEVDRRTGIVTDGAFFLTERWDDAPVGGEYETHFIGDVDDLGRGWSSAEYVSGVLDFACTYEWDGLVPTGWTCEYGGEEPYLRERTERIDGPDGRVAEWRVYQEYLSSDTGTSESLEWVYKVSWSCSAAE